MHIDSHCDPIETDYLKANIPRCDSTIGNHEYVNSNLSAMIREAKNDYDLVPSGTPIPVGSFRKSKSLTSYLSQSRSDNDYDIPRSSANLKM